MNQQTLLPHTDTNIRKKSEYNDLLTQCISESLLDLGFKSKLKGYIYTKEAIYLYARNPLINSIYVDIYSKIAQKYNVTAATVDHTIKSAIEATWYSNEFNYGHRLMNCSSIKFEYPPTNSEFLATMAELVKCNIKRM